MAPNTKQNNQEKQRDVDNCQQRSTKLSKERGSLSSREQFTWQIEILDYHIVPVSLRHREEHGCHVTSPASQPHHSTPLLYCNKSKEDLTFEADDNATEKNRSPVCRASCRGRFPQHRTLFAEPLLNLQEIKVKKHTTRI